VLAYVFDRDARGPRRFVFYEDERRRLPALSAGAPTSESGLGRKTNLALVRRS
jgi:hypothetical protein